MARGGEWNEKVRGAIIWTALVTAVGGTEG